MEFMSYHFSNEYPELKKNCPYKKLFLIAIIWFQLLNLTPPPKKCCTCKIYKTKQT